MTRVKLFSCLLFIVLKTNGQYLWQIYPDTIIKWNYYDGDEFNKAFINNDRWHIGFPWGKNIISQSTLVSDSNIYLNTSIARFILKQDSNLIKLEPWQIDTIKFKKDKINLVGKNKILFKYSGALLWSKKQFKYGYFEIKFKAPDGQGIWPAFWLYAGNANNEIDFFELKGEQERKIHVDIHCPEGCSNYKEFLNYRKGWGHWVNTDQTLKENYNVVSGEWSPDFVKWYLNGNLIAYSNHSFDMPMNLTVGTGIAKNNGAFKPGPNKKTPFPNFFDVDYVRVYKTDTLPNLRMVKDNLTLNSDTLFKNKGGDLKAKKTRKKLINKPKGIKTDPFLITLSVTQVSSFIFSIRALGITDNDTLIISILNNSNELIRKIFVKEAGETLFLSEDRGDYTLRIEVNGQIIKEKIRFE